MTLRCRENDYSNFTTNHRLVLELRSTTIIVRFKHTSRTVKCLVVCAKIMANYVVISDLSRYSTKVLVKGLLWQELYCDKNSFVARV